MLVENVVKEEIAQINAPSEGKDDDKDANINTY